jgi:ABC-type glycerol-3-phosphate transport system substrate-binding protein
MKKLITIAIAAAVAFSLAGCSGAGLANNAASYKSGKNIGQATNQDALELMGYSDIDTFCSDLSQDSEITTSTEGFSEDEFVKGCVDGFNEANG